MYRIILCLLWLSVTAYVHAQKFTELSPDGHIHLTVQLDNALTYAVEYDGQPLITPSPLRVFWSNGIDLRKSQLHVKKVKRAKQSGKIKPVYGFASEYAYAYKEITIQFREQIDLIFRVYNQGVAWHFVSRIDDGNGSQPLFVLGEKATFNFEGDPMVHFPQVKDFQNSFEENYLPLSLSNISPEAMALTPTLVQSEAGPWVLISEANLQDYPGMYLRRSESGLQALFPPHVSKQSQELLGRLGLKLAVVSGMEVRKRSNYLARTQSGRAFPWRVLMIAPTEADLATNNLIYALAPPLELTNTDWIKPGKVAWDWYHAWQLEGVPFEPGINTETYLHYIDFAAANGFDYINLDEGWTNNKDLMDVSKDIDIARIVTYGQSKGVGVFVWMIWWVLDEEMDTYLDQFAQWGVAGIKVDFMDRDDEQVVEFYWRLAQEAAKRKLLINYHGAYKPTGLAMAYPNVINREGVVGLENNKFSERCTPTHNLTIPFTRNVVGPMDYTPGGMRYVAPADFKQKWKQPTAMTTRMQQLAMYIVYYGPLQMISDAPHLYPPEALQFLSQVPTVWQDSKCLDGVLGEYIVMARRSGNTWFVGGMTADEGKDYSVRLNFLERGATYAYTLYQDGDSLEDIIISEGKVKVNDVISTKMKPTGGFTLVLKKI